MGTRNTEPRAAVCIELIPPMRGFYDMRWDQSDLVSARPDMADVGGGVLVYVFAVVGFKGSCDGGVVALDPMRL